MESFSFLDDMEDEKKRLLADRRKTNLAITPRVVALPKILKIFFMKFKVRVPCTTSDLFSGYWQVCLRKRIKGHDHVHGTFRRAVSMHQCTRAQFGLAVSAAAILATLAHVLCRLWHNRQLHCYVIDVIFD